MAVQVKKFKVTHVGIRTMYEVQRNGLRVGWIWSRVGFSYRGTQGMNRGIRLRDFHPIEWRYSATYPTLASVDGKSAYNRRQAVARLLEE